MNFLNFFVQTFYLSFSFLRKNPNYIYRYFLESPMSGGGFDHKRGNRHENRHQDSHNSCVVVNDNLGGRRVSLG